MQTVTNTFPIELKEFTFLRNNLDEWQRLEIVVANAASESPDTLAEAYTKLTGDLAFARTHYPHSRITLYLNSLCASLHNSIYGTKREPWRRLLTFWSHEVPLTMYDNRRLLLSAFIVALVSTIVGIVSQILDPEFCRVILGDNYVDMTLENIANGKPMAVYSGQNEAPMFLGITINNVCVSFTMFASGLLTSFATGILLFQNTVMLGCFEAFFAQHGLLVESLLAVFLHGTLEISAIIIAAAAGFAIGNGWLFPGTYPRKESFRRGAQRGMKIIVGTIPVFIVAGFIEGFVTRHTEIPDALRLIIILLSLAFIIGYFVILPIKRHKEQIVRG